MAKLDYDLIYLKSENARISLKNLSKELKKSSQRLKYSLCVLEKEGIITNPYCVFDYSYFGLILFRVYFKGIYVGEHDKAKIISELSNNPYIVAIRSLTGEFDLAVEFASPNPSKFNKELKKIVELNPTLNDYKVILNLVTYIYPKNYLAKKIDISQSNMEKIIGGDREIETFAANELAVIKNLCTAPTARLTALAESSGLNVKTIKSILNNLIKRKIIKGFKYVLDTTKMDISSFRLFLKLHNLSVEREAVLMNYLLSTKEIVQLNKTVGDWDMEIDLEALDKSKIRTIIMQLREEFKDLIEKFNLIEVYDTHSKSYLPPYLFKEL